MVLIFFFRAIRGKEENREPAGKDLMHSFFPYGPPALEITSSLSSASVGTRLNGLLLLS